MTINFKWLLLISLIFVACNKDDKNTAAVPVTHGSADFTKYVALGDSFTAGYSDGALFAKGQEGSYANVLSQLFTPAGGGVFTTPLMLDNIGGFSPNGVQVAKFPTRLIFDLATSSPENIEGTSKTPITAHLTGLFNNMGIPGARSFHLIVPGYGNIAGISTTPATANPYFVRIASSGSATVLGDAMAQKPTFFSLWIGGNDVLAYATNGGDSALGDVITPTATFDSVYNTLVNTLTASGAKGVVVNLPYVNTLPYFTTVPVNPLTVGLLGGVAFVKGLNDQLYGPLKTVLTDLGAGDRINLLSETAANPLLIKDETLPDLSAQLIAAFTPKMGLPTATIYGRIFGQARQAKQTTDFKDYILLTTKPVIGTAPAGVSAPLDRYGITYPLEDKHVLIQAEVKEIEIATDAYNITIETAAKAKGLAFVDTKSVMTKLSGGGINFGNFNMTATYPTGGAFSLDGIHPSPRGYALIANIIADAINEKYKSTLRHVDLANYPIQYPKILQ